MESRVRAIAGAPSLFDLGRAADHASCRAAQSPGGHHLCRGVVALEQQEFRF